MGLVSFKTNVSETAGQIHSSDNVRCKGHSHLSYKCAMEDASNAFTSQTKVSFAFKTQIEICLKIKHV